MDRVTIQAALTRLRAQDDEDEKPIRRRRAVARQPLDTRTLAQYDSDARAIQAAIRIECGDENSGLGVHHGHNRGFLGGRLLDDRKRADERMNRRYGHVDYSAEREARARRAAAEWKPEVLGRRLVGKPGRDRRNPLKGDQNRRVETWDRVCRYNAELGIDRPAPETAAGFRLWLENKVKARDEAAAREVARLAKAQMIADTRAAELDDRIRAAQEVPQHARPISGKVDLAQVKAALSRIALLSSR